MIDTMAKIVDANKKLRGKLTTAEQRLEEQAVRIDFHLAEARIDSLTGLANRRCAFDDELDRRFAEWERTQIPVLPAVFGHSTASRIVTIDTATWPVTRCFATRLMYSIRPCDRWISSPATAAKSLPPILPSTSLADPQPPNASARFLADAECQFEELGLRITVSIGVSEVLVRDNPRSLFKRCDAALYAAKSDGRNCSFFHDAAGPSRVVSPVESLVSEELPEDELWTKVSAVEQDPASGQPDESSLLLDRRTFVEHFHVHLQEARRLGRPMSLLLVHIDRLQKLNGWGGADAVDSTMHAIGQVVNRRCATPISPAAMAGTSLRSCCPAWTSSMPRRSKPACTRPSRKQNSPSAPDHARWSLPAWRSFGLMTTWPALSVEAPTISRRPKPLPTPGRVCVPRAS